MKHVVIIGGGFAGAYCAHALEKNFNVTLIDTKDYFEFTPGILRVIVNPEHIKKIQVLHSHYLKKTKLILGEAQEISNTYVNIKGKKIPFDYLVISSGSSYQSNIKQGGIIMATRANVLKNAHEELVKSEKILIIGGGLVGVELAAEISQCFPHKDITIVHEKDNLIDRNSHEAIRYAEAFLRKMNVNILCNERVIKKEKDFFITDKKRKIKADMTFLCTGIKPNFKFMKKYFAKSLSEKNRIKVNNYLQIEGYKNIFSAGDITDRREEKTAQNAEKQAQIIVNNILALEKNKSLKEYHSKPRVLVISLGKYAGILNYKNFVLTGIIPALIKKGIEWEAMLKYRGLF